MAGVVERFLVPGEEQSAAVRRLIEQLDDDQLATQLQFEWERRRQVALQITAAINISDGERSPEQPPNVARTRGGQPDEARVEQPEVTRPEEPAEVEQEQQ